MRRAMSTDDVAKAVRDVQLRLEDKIKRRQAGVPTFFDNLLLAGVRRLRMPPSESLAEHGRNGALDFRDVFRRFAAFSSRQRFVGAAERAVETGRWQRLPWELTRVQLHAMQGVEMCLEWRGLPLFKSVFDFALYPMLLWEVRPATVIELGSGTGASAVWLGDLLRMFGIDGHVYSVDLDTPDVQAENVSFIGGDCRRIERIFTPEALSQLPHPWVVIEDVHVNTLGVLLHFAASVCPGDLLIVEDSCAKWADLERFERETGGMFKVDTRYTDFFGRNMTSSADAILVKR